MADSAPEYAVDALDRAIRGRGTATRRGAAAGGGAAHLDEDSAAKLGDAAFSLPSLSFKFRAPSFLGNRSRWVLFILLLGVATLALFLAWDMVKVTSATEGEEWVWPPILTLIVAAVAVGFAFAAVMGFGEVDLSTSIGEAPAAAASGLKVSTTVPPDNATDSDANAQIEATFSEAIDPASLTSASFLLRRSTDRVLVAGTVSTDTDGVTGRLAPSAALEAKTGYEVEITTAVKTKSGTPLATAKKWTFTTAG